MNRAECPIPYDEELYERIVHMHRGARELPGYDGWIRDHMGGRVVTFREHLLPNILAFTDLRGLEILDFGCGTGSSTVVLAERAHGGRILGTDIDGDSLEVARLRLQHHSHETPVAFQAIEPVRRVGDLPLADGRFDLIVLNGVLEHVVPHETRAQVILEVWRVLAPNGLLYINETPNPLWPIDRHTTGLPLLPWLPSRWAHRVAVRAGRHRDDTDLDARGRRGMTFWEIVRPLRRGRLPYEVCNITQAGNRLLPAGSTRRLGVRRRLGTFVLEGMAGRVLGWCGVPSLALTPWIDHLCLRKLAATD